MAKFFDEIPEKLQTFMREQQVFFVATARDTGRISLSPKGMNTFRVLDAKTVGYLDLTGSGNETSAHIEADGRMTIMFCSFDSTPLILRLYGRGRVVWPDSSQWPNLARHFDLLPGARQIILLDVDSLQTSCGFGVPVAEGMTGRETLQQWAETKGPEGIRAYQQKNNLTSIDGLPTGMESLPF